MRPQKHSTSRKIKARQAKASGAGKLASGLRTRQTTTSRGSALHSANSVAGVPAGWGRLPRAAAMSAAQAAPGQGRRRLLRRTKACLRAPLEPAARGRGAAVRTRTAVSTCPVPFYNGMQACPSNYTVADVVWRPLRTSRRQHEAAASSKFGGQAGRPGASTWVAAHQPHYVLLHAPLWPQHLAQTRIRDLCFIYVHRNRGGLGSAGRWGLGAGPGFAALISAAEPVQVTWRGDVGGQAVKLARRALQARVRTAWRSPGNFVAEEAHPKPCPRTIQTSKPPRCHYCPSRSPVMRHPAPSADTLPAIPHLDVPVLIHKDI